VLDGDVDGTRQAINYLRSMRDMLAGHAKKPVNVTVKWDGCVHEDTVVLTENGEEKISDLMHTTSNLVLAFDEKRKIPVMSPIENRSNSVGNKNWIEVVLDNGSIIKLTEDHEVLTTNRGWTAAKDLTVNDDIKEL
jgi:hypothetical protein